MAKKNKRARAMSGALLLASVGAVGSAGSVGSAFAAGTGGGGGSGICMQSACNATPPWTWSYVSTDSGRSAWNKFAGADAKSWGDNGQYNSFTTGYIFPRIMAYGMTNTALLQTCQNSKAIWWVSSSKPYVPGKQNGWVWNYGSKSYPSTTSGSSLSSAKVMDNSSMDSNLLKATNEWAKGIGASNFVVICSGQFGKEGLNGNPSTPSSIPSTTTSPSGAATAPSGGGVPVKPAATVENFTNTKPVEVKQEWTQPYSYNTMISRQHLADDNSKDPIGKDNLHDQASFQKTSFAALWDDMQKNPGKYASYTSDQVKTLVEKAEEEDKAATHSVVNFDDKNKEGIAEGGVLNITQYTKKATIHTSQVVGSQVQNCTRTTDWIYDDATSTWVPGTPDVQCGAWQNSSSSAQTPLTLGNTVESTLKQTAFWQMLGVHCNKAQFEALAKNAAGSQIVDTGDSSKGISAMIYSKKYDTQPTYLDFGDQNNPNPALSASSKLGFFDKECPFDCTSTSKGPGASAANGAINNIGSSKPTGNGATVGRYGAVSGNNNDSNLSFFRDNVQHLISTDVWYPTVEGVVKYSGEAPLSTTINRWVDGTPSVDGSDGGKFTMSVKNGVELFTGDDTPATQKNYSVDTFSNATSTEVAGLARAFNVQATWASQKGKPQTFNFKWEYAPTVITKAAVNGVGFDGSNNVIGTTTTLPANVQGKCYALYGNASKIDTSEFFNTGTGTGTKNTLDNGLIQGDGSDAANLYVKFVRSTTE